jgi:hypothetical protein
MPYGIFKEIKIRCNVCNSVVVSKSDTTWTDCPCGSCSVMGLKSFIKKKGNCTDLSTMDFSQVPEHRGWDHKREDYYKNQ